MGSSLSAMLELGMERVPYWMNIESMNCFLEYNEMIIAFKISQRTADGHI